MAESIANMEMPKSAIGCYVLFRFIGGSSAQLEEMATPVHFTLKFALRILQRARPDRATDDGPIRTVKPVCPRVAGLSFAR